MGHHGSGQHTEGTAVRWEDCSALFAWNGCWRELRVPGCSLDDWQRLLDHLRETQQALHFSDQGRELPLPEAAAELLACRGESSWAMLRIELEGLALHCHIRAADELALTLDPREVQGPREADALFEFMRGLGRGLGKPVQLTPADAPQVLLEYDPAADELCLGE